MINDESSNEQFTRLEFESAWACVMQPFSRPSITGPGSRDRSCDRCISQNHVLNNHDKLDFHRQLFSIKFTAPDVGWFEFSRFLSLANQKQQSTARPAWPKDYRVIVQKPEIEFRDKFSESKIPQEMAISYLVKNPKISPSRISPFKNLRQFKFFRNSSKILKFSARLRFFNFKIFDEILVDFCKILVGIFFKVRNGFFTSLKPQNRIWIELKRRDGDLFSDPPTQNSELGRNVVD